MKASPVSDLGSPSPEIRARAADAIISKDSYQPTSRVPWDQLTAELKEGESTQDVAIFLRRHGIIKEPFQFQRAAVYEFQLDESWVLLCAINKLVLTQFQIRDRPREVFVQPPPNFTGLWRTYRLNGHLARLQYYRKGMPENIDNPSYEPGAENPWEMRQK